MKLYTHKKLIEKAGAVLDLIEYASKRIKTREENLKQYQVFTGLVAKYEHDNEITKLAKARLEKYYKSIIAKIQALILDDRNLDQKLDEIEKLNTVTTEDLETAVRVLEVTIRNVKYESRKEYHEFKRSGKGINFDNVQTLRGQQDHLLDARKLILNSNYAK